MIFYLVLFPTHLTLAQTTLYNGITLPSAWPPQQGPSQAYQIPSYVSSPPSVIPIDLGRQLFVDDFLIQQTSLTRSAHRPVMYGNNPVLSPGGPDLKGWAFPYSDGVWYDPADHLFKMWYFGSYGNMISYAYSTDGKNWTKPLLNIVIPSTNTVIQDGGGRDSDTVWMDLDDPNSARKFKAFVLRYPPITDVYLSPDGIHWSAPQPQTINSVSDRSTVFWNPFRKVWVDSVRSSTTLPAIGSAPNHYSRVRYYSESLDLINWTPLNPLNSFWTGPDVNDPPYAGPGGALPELYNLDAVAYESILVGLFSWYNPGPSYSPSYGPGPNLVELGVGFSRDGFNWVRPTRGGGGNAFIPASNTAGTWNGYNTQSAGGGFLVVGDELWFYFSGRDQPKPAMGVASTGLATLRRDGFYSMDAGATEGVLTTRPVAFSGKYLFVNVNNPGGSLQVEVLDSSGAVIAPFTKQNSVPVSVNKTLQQITWNGVADLSTVVGKPAQFRFYLTNGQLYSFWVAQDMGGVSNGYVAAGGPGFTGNRDTIGSGGGGPPPPTPPALSVTPSSLSFTGTAGGGNPAAQSATVSNSGGGTLTWTASANQPWITFSPASGTGAQTVSVGTTISGLAVGTYSGAVTLSAPGATPSTQTVNVSLSIAAAPTPPALSVTPSSLSFTGTAGGSKPAAQSATVSNSGGGTLTWTASANQPWITFSPASGTGAQTVSVGTTISGLAVGAYSGAVTLSAPGATPSTQTVNVSLSIAAAPTPPALSVTPSSLSFTGTAGGSKPAAQSATVSNSGGGTLTWTASANQPWITFSPASGTGAQTVSVGTTISGLAVGTYSGAVTLSAPGATPSTQTVNVSLSITAAPPPPTPPALSVTPSSLSFTGTAGGGNPAAQSATVSNSGGGTLTWTASANQPWITFSPTSGTGAQTVSVGTTISGLAVGAYSGAVTLSAPGATPSTQTVNVSLSITAAPPPPSASGPTGYWTLDSASVTGGQVLDSSGNNLKGSLLGGATSVTGAFNQALSFDGRTSYIQFPSDALTDLTNDLSLALWVRTQNTSRTEALLSRYSAAAMEFGYALRSTAAGHVDIRIGGNNWAGGYATTLTDTGKAINDGNWHHVAVVIALGRGVSFYIDGALSSAPALNAVAHTSGVNLQIASTHPYYGNLLTGSLDDVRIYNRALSASEIAALAAH